jgi:hypothetical protein
VNRILKAIVFLLAAIYFLVDAIFLTVAKSLANRIAGLWIFERLRGWIVSLPRYPTLALFALPVAVLEPVKPMAAYLIGTGRAATGLIFLAGGEVLKLVLVERLFCICRDKLMSIPAFAWTYSKYCGAMKFITSMKAWQAVRRWSLLVRYVIRRYMDKLKAPRGQYGLIAPSGRAFARGRDLGRLPAK